MRSGIHLQGYTPKLGAYVLSKLLNRYQKGITPHFKSRKVRCLCGFPALCLLFELFFQFVASPVFRCFFSQNRIFLMRFCFSFIWCQSWCTQIVSIHVFSYFLHTLSTLNKITKNANTPCTSINIFNQAQSFSIMQYLYYHFSAVLM